MLYGDCLPEEVVPAEQLVVPGVAFVRQRRPAIGAPDARGMPCPLQDVEQELVQDRLLAAGARHGAASLPSS